MRESEKRKETETDKEGERESEKRKETETDKEGEREREMRESEKRRKKRREKKTRRSTQIIHTNMKSVAMVTKCKHEKISTHKTTHECTYPTANSG